METARNIFLTGFLSLSDMNCGSLVLGDRNDNISKKTPIASECSKALAKVCAFFLKKSDTIL